MAYGAEFERRRRENRGAVDAEGERCGRWCPPPHRGRGLEGGCAPSPENFLILALRMVVFFKVELFVLHAKISVLRLPKLAIARCICHSPEFFLFYFDISQRCFVAIYSPSLRNLSWHFWSLNKASSAKCWFRKCRFGSWGLSCIVSEISVDEKLQTPSVSGSPILYTQI